MCQVNNEKGVALIFTLLVVVVLVTLGGIFVLRTVNEKALVEREKGRAQSFYLAEAASEAGLDKVDELINTYMFNTINAKNPQLVGNHAGQAANNGDGISFLIDYVKDVNIALLTLSGTDAVYNGSLTNLGAGIYQFDITLSQKTLPVAVTSESWDFPFYYEIKASGSVDGATRVIKLTGDFTARVQKDNFAKFALFTDHHGLPSGGTVWFTDKTNFAGPIHTNERYSFAFNPGGIFEGEVTQQNSNARFYNNGSPVLIGADFNGIRDVPVFNESYTRGFDQIVLASSVQKQDLYDQAKGDDDPVGNGIFVANDGSSLSGGIFVRGDTSITMGVDGSDNATYTITEGATTKIVTVDLVNDQTTIETVGVGTETLGGIPRGVDDLGTIIYVDGDVMSLSGTVQKDTEVTISSEFDVVISDDIQYSDYTAAVGNPGDAGYVPPNADGTTNLLGVVAWGGDVRIETTAPDDINIHGILMARNGVFAVDDYDDEFVGSRGVATLLGGAITQFYGAFGLFSGATGQQLAGFGRNFVYDGRALLGKSPPYFPSMKTFVAFTNDITDKIVFQEGAL
ncbi:MAG: DUF4900 domain-containing protein [Candidatus Omnitrophica bacterium]|nr:DUF4900 domain-containing protein [Candidatus Omnitrophota bacterium]